MPASGRLSFRASGIFRTSVSIFPGFARFFVQPDWPVPFSGKFRRLGFSGRGAALNAFRIKPVSYTHLLRRLFVLYDYDL